MCGFEATNLPATNVQKHVGLQSTQNVDKVARLPENLRADVTNRELQVNKRGHTHKTIIPNILKPTFRQHSM